MGVIITADCDLAHQKHRGVLNFVPLLRTLDYLAIGWLHQHMIDGQAQLADEICRLVRLAHEAVVGKGNGRLTDERLKEWVLEQDPVDIAAAVAMPPGDVRDRFLRLAEGMQAIAQADQYAYSDQLRNLKIISGLGFGKKLATISQQVNDYVQKLPGDAFFLNGGANLNEPGGYVCYLRLVQTVSDADVSLTNSALIDGAVRTYRRIGRLRSPFVYALTQRLGDVFSSIGLPTAYEGSRATNAALVREAMTAGEP